MAIPGMEDYPIELGTLLFTMVEPERGREVEYNHWYEHDHFYSGCMVGEWQFAGDRFVATKRLKELRYPAQSDMTPDPSTGSYLAVYWVLEGKHDEVEPVGGGAGHVAAHERPHVRGTHAHPHVALREALGAHRAEDDSVTIELALDHHFTGLVVVAGDVKDGHTHDEVDAWFRDTYLPDACAQPWGPEVVLDATTLPLLDERPADVPPPVAGSATASCSSTSSTTIPRRGGPRATRVSARRSRTVGSPRTCGRVPSSRPTSAPTGTPTSSGRRALVGELSRA